MRACGDPGMGGPTHRQDSSAHTPSFQACSSPMGRGSHPRSLGPLEVAQDNPVALAPARRHLVVRGKATPAPSLSTTQSLSFPSAQVKLGRQWQILLGHPKDKKTEAQGILPARGLGDGLEMAYFFPPPPGNGAPAVQPRGRACPGSPSWGLHVDGVYGFPKPGG